MANNIIFEVSSEDNESTGATRGTLSPYENVLPPLLMAQWPEEKALPATCIMDLTQEDGGDHEMDISVPSTSTGATSSASLGGTFHRPRRVSVGSLEDTNKTNTALEKEAQKRRVAEERAAKRAANEMNKIYKPGECMKYMSVEAHPTLCEAWYMGDVSREVTAAGAKLVSAPSLCHPALLVWCRATPHTLDAAHGQVRLSPAKQPCDRALYVTTAEQVAEHVRDHTLPTHIADIRDLSDCNMTLVIFGVKDYYKSSRRKTLNSNRSPMTEIELEMAITDLLVSAECDTVIVNTPNELALLIVQFTKAIAEAPFKTAKRACDEQAAFYMRGESKKCVAVDKDGVGVSRLWQQMIAILPLSSLETSRALCAQYKSPLALYEALQSPDSDNKIADIGVSRAAAPGAKARRIGPEFARKLRTLFTAQDGNVLVD